MKILHLTTHLEIGGIASYVVSLASELKRKGVEVICASRGGALVAQLERCGVRHVCLPLCTKNELHPKLIFSLLELKDLIKEEEIDLIHVHTRVTQVLAQSLRNLLKTPYVSTCHGFYKRRILRRLYPCWGDRIIAVSEPVREALVNDFKVPKSKISLIPSGVDIENFSPKLTPQDRENLRRYFRLKKRGRIIGSVSRLVESKGLQYLVQAAPFVLDVFPDTSFFIVGCGRYKTRLEHLIRKRHLTAHFDFAGAVKHAASALELVDVFVSPSISGEGFGIACLEAMAVCKPIVATDVGSIYTLVKENVNGFLVSPSNPRQLAERLIDLLKHPERARSMGEEGRRIARERFSLERVTAQMMALYREVIKGS